MCTEFQGFGSSSLALSGTFAGSLSSAHVWDANATVPVPIDVFVSNPPQDLGTSLLPNFPDSEKPGSHCLQHIDLSSHSGRLLGPSWFLCCSPALCSCFPSCLPYPLQLGRPSQPPPPREKEGNQSVFRGKVIGKSVWKSCLSWSLPAKSRLSSLIVKQPKCHLMTIF